MTTCLVPTFSAYQGSQKERDMIVDWFSGKVTDFTPSGTRSVFLKLSDQVDLKIKGAGFPPDYRIHFEERHRTGPRAFRFDYEGRRMEDIAIGHDTAFKGGMSYQQAAVEYLASSKLSELGYTVVPCAGWGTVRGSADNEVSFFAALYWDKKIVRANSKACPDELRLHLLKRSTQLLADIQLNHLISTFFAVGMLDNSEVIYDLHPTRMISRITDSPISATMQTIFNMRVRWWALKTFSSLEKEVDAVKFADEVFRSVLPDLGYDECRALEVDVIKPILTSHGSQDYLESIAILNSNRLGTFLLKRFESVLM